MNARLGMVLAAGWTLIAAAGTAAAQEPEPATEPQIFELAGEPYVIEIAGAVGEETINDELAQQIISIGDEQFNVFITDDEDMDEPMGQGREPRVTVRRLGDGGGGGPRMNIQGKVMIVGPDGQIRHFNLGGPGRGDDQPRAKRAPRGEPRSFTFKAPAGPGTPRMKVFRFEGQEGGPRGEMHDHFKHIMPPGGEPHVFRFRADRQHDGGHDVRIERRGKIVLRGPDGDVKQFKLDDEGNQGPRVPRRIEGEPNIQMFKTPRRAEGVQQMPGGIKVERQGRRIIIELPEGFDEQPAPRRRGPRSDAGNVPAREPARVMPAMEILDKAI